MVYMVLWHFHIHYCAYANELQHQLFDQNNICQIVSNTGYKRNRCVTN